MSIRFDDRVVIVTGAGGGLGRQHAIEFAKRGAKVVVNDFGGAVDGNGGSSEPAEKVVAEIKAEGGEAIAHGANVADPSHVQDMVEKTMSAFGKVDVLVNNAGILRDSSFGKMTPENFKAVVDVHLLGTAYCSLAVWNHMKAAGYGRILMTASSSGVYGNFGQANYGAAKMGVVGLMNVLHLEGQKYDIRVNTLLPTAATRMTEGLMPDAMLRLVDAASVTPAALFLTSEDAPARAIMGTGAGGYARTYVLETEGVYLPPEERTPKKLAELWVAISDKSELHEYTDGGGMVMKFIKKAADDTGVDLGF